jgi:hypothetical protein
VAAAQLARASVQTWRAASLELDVDTPDDLRVLAETLAERPEAAPRTAAVLAELPLAALAAG